ncbi:MAG: hypothetical protein V8S38_04910 [Lachnospiraceae bacterium]
MTLEKTGLNSQENWNGNGFIDAEQVADAYTLETDVEKVYVYFPGQKTGYGRCGTARWLNNISIKVRLVMIISLVE